MNDGVPVLVVDDDKSIQGIVEETLIEDGFRPTIVSSGEEAINLLVANRYRVLVLDISLGRDRIKGWPIARRARAFSPDMPVIYITGGPRDDWAVEGVPNSVLLAKPFAPAQLVTAVMQLLNKANVAGWSPPNASEDAEYCAWRRWRFSLNDHDLNPTNAEEAD